MQRGERDLRGADQEELVLRDLVDHLPLAGEEAGAVERLLADQHRRDDRREALRRRASRPRSGPAPARPAPGRRSGRRSGSPRPRPPPPISISRGARPRSRWSRGSKSNSGRSPTSRSTTASSSVSPSGASGSGRLGSVAASSSRSASTSSSSASSALISAETSRIARDRLARRRRPRAWPRRSRRRPRCCSARQLLDLRAAARGGARRARAAVEVPGGAAARERGPRGRLRVLADALRSSRGSAPGRPSASELGVAPSRRLRPASSASGARVLLEELGDRLGVVADDDVLGHDRAGEAAVADREERVVVGLDRAGRSSGPGRAARGWPSPGSRPRSACGSPSSAAAKISAPACGRVVARAPSTPSLPQAARAGRARATAMSRDEAAHAGGIILHARPHGVPRPRPAADPPRRASARAMARLSDRRHAWSPRSAADGPARARRPTRSPRSRSIRR